MQWGLFWFWNWILLTIVYHTWALIARKILNFVHIFYNFVYFLSRFVWYNRIKKWEERIKKDVFHCNSMLNSIKILYTQKNNHLFWRWHYFVFARWKAVRIIHYGKILSMWAYKQWKELYYEQRKNILKVV